MVKKLQIIKHQHTIATWCVVILIGVLPVISCVGQNAKPKIVFNHKVHHFGDISQHAKAECSFTFHNTGNAPLMIQKVTSSCRCTLPQWPHTPIMPGDSSTIQLTYRTDFPGIIYRPIEVWSNATRKPITLLIKGSVMSHTDASPIK
ncbi:MAG: DUF1573 domain-containing protein [Marinilabiliaceae bacterium]|nr:DUF1573 domain-containing protein [Marinilabiliaceae bacterium]